MINKHLQILRPIIFMGIGLAFAFIGASVDTLNIGSRADLKMAALYQAASPTPAVTTVSQVGSTDQIMLMGVVITVIVILPILFRRSTWTNK